MPKVLSYLEHVVKYWAVLNEILANFVQNMIGSLSLFSRRLHIQLSPATGVEGGYPTGEQELPTVGEIWLRQHIQG